MSDPKSIVDINERMSDTEIDTYLDHLQVARDPTSTPVKKRKQAASAFILRQRQAARNLGQALVNASTGPDRNQKIRDVPSLIKAIKDAYDDTSYPQTWVDVKVYVVGAQGRGQEDDWTYRAHGLTTSRGWMCKAKLDNSYMCLKCKDGVRATGFNAVAMTIEVMDSQDERCAISIYDRGARSLFAKSPDELEASTDDQKDVMVGDVSGQLYRIQGQVTPGGNTAFHAFVLH
jgi:hypothetical protein